MNEISLKPAQTVTELASARQHQENRKPGRPSCGAREVPKAGGVVGPKYRATRALRGPRAFRAEVGRGRAICA